jgi:hypothetical protein
LFQRPRKPGQHHLQFGHPSPDTPLESWVCRSLSSEAGPATVHLVPEARCEHSENKWENPQHNMTQHNATPHRTPMKTRRVHMSRRDPPIHTTRTRHRLHQNNVENVSRSTKDRLQIKYTAMLHNRASTRLCFGVPVKHGFLSHRYLSVRARVPQVST